MTTKTVIVRLEALVAQYQAKMAAATASTRLFGQQATGITSKTASGFSALSLGAIGFGSAIALGLGKAIDAALDFEKAFTQISALSNASAADVERWKSQVLSLSGETARAPTELADALYFLSSAGLAVDDVMPALEASAKGAAVGLGSTADVANIVASALNAYADSGLTATQVTDTLVEAVKAGRAAPDEFAGALGRILPIAAATGVSFDQVTASLAALSNIGLDVNEGVTAMRGVLQAIAAPGSQAAQAMSQIGLSAQDLLDVIKTDGLLGALQKIDAAARANSKGAAEYNSILRQIVPNVRSLTGVLGQTGQNAEHVALVYQDVANSAGALDRAFATTTQGPAFQFSQLMAELQRLLIGLGEALLPLAVNIVNAFSSVLGPVVAVVEAIAQMPGVVDLVTSALVALVAVKAVDFLHGVAVAATEAALANAELAASETAAATAGTLYIANASGVVVAQRAVAAASQAAAAGTQAAAGAQAGLVGTLARIAPALALVKGAMVGLQEFHDIFTDHDLEKGIRTVGEGMRFFNIMVPDMGPTTTELKDINTQLRQLDAGFRAGTISVTDYKDAVHAVAEEAGVDLPAGFDQTIDRIAGYNALNIVAQQQIDATNAALDDQRDAAIRSGDGLDYASKRFLEFADRMGIDGQSSLLKWREAVSKAAEDNGQAVKEFLAEVSGDWQDFRASIAESINFAPDLISELESAAQQARDTLAGDVSGTSSADLAKLRADADLTAQEILRAFREAKRQTKSFAGDLLTISRTGGSAGKALAASFLEAGDVIAAQVVANAPARMRDQIVQAFGAGQSAADNLSTKLANSIAAPLKDIRDILITIAQSWGLDVSANTSGAEAALNHIETRLNYLDNHKYTVSLGFTGIDLPPGVKHAGGTIGGLGARRMHSGGMLRGDEEWFIGQRGERVLSQSQNAAFEKLFGTSMRPISDYPGASRSESTGGLRLIEGELQMTNWDTGKGHMRAIARDELDQDGAYGERLARMQRR